MPILDNARWEVMANQLAQGKKPPVAYKTAGFSPNYKNAMRLAEKVEIAARVRELQQVAVAETTLTIQRILDELEKIGFANMLDYIRINDDGQPVLDFSALDRARAAAIGEITTSETTSPRDGSITRHTKFKLLDKRLALIDMGKYLGMWVDRKDIRVAGVMFHVNDADNAL